VQVRHQEQIYRGAANIGPNPTFGEFAQKIEVFLLDFQGDLYGENLQVDFWFRIRDTMKFSGVDALVTQMNQDVEMVRRCISLEK
jgi:riboflavin kinase/FMN adenylyltransferase